MSFFCLLSLKWKLVRFCLLIKMIFMFSKIWFIQTILWEFLLTYSEIQPGCFSFLKIYTLKKKLEDLLWDCDSKKKSISCEIQLCKKEKKEAWPNVWVMACSKRTSSELTITWGFISHRIEKGFVFILRKLKRLITVTLLCTLRDSFKYILAFVGINWNQKADMQDDLGQMQ